MNCTLVTDGTVSFEAKETNDAQCVVISSLQRPKTSPHPYPKLIWKTVTKDGWLQNRLQSQCLYVGHRLCTNDDILAIKLK